MTLPHTWFSKSLLKLQAEVIQAKDVPKTVRIVITSKMVNGDRFFKGVEESLQPVLQKVALHYATNCPAAFVTA